MEYFMQPPYFTGLDGSSKPTSLLQTMDDPANFDVMKMVYAGSFVFVVAIVIGIFKNRGFLVISGILAYLLSLSTMTLTVKNVFVSQKFGFPKFVTSMHFVACGILCFSIMLYKQMKGEKKMPIPSMEQMTKIIVPISIAFAASVGANNVALLHCNAAFAEMIGGSAPLCVIAITICEGKVFDMRLLVPVLSVVGGVCLCALGELSFTLLGFSLVFLATFLRAFKSNLQHKIMGDTDPSEKLEPIELLAWMSPPCLAVMALWGGFTEGLEPLYQLTWQTSAAIGVTCINACVLNVANNFVIRDLGAVGCMLAGQLKGILLIMGATVMLGEVVQIQQVGGYVFIAGGVYFYNKMEKDIKEGTAKLLKKDIEAAQEQVPIVQGGVSHPNLAKA